MAAFKPDWDYAADKEEQDKLEEFFLCMEKTDLVTARKRRAAYVAMNQTGLVDMFGLTWWERQMSTELPVGGCSLFKHVDRHEITKLTKETYMHLFGEQNWKEHHDAEEKWQACCGNGCPWCDPEVEIDDWRNNDVLCQVERCPEPHMASSDFCPTHCAQAFKMGRCTHCLLPLNQAKRCFLNTSTPEERSGHKKQEYDPPPLPFDVQLALKERPKKRART